MNDASWVLCKFMILWYASSWCDFMQVYDVILCKFMMWLYASLWWYDMQVYDVMICKYVMSCYASMLCKFGLNVYTCYHVMRTYYEFMNLKLQALCQKVAFWQHISYHSHMITCMWGHMRTYGHFYMPFFTMYHSFDKFGFYACFWSLNMQYEHMYISYATMLNLWLQHPLSCLCQVPSFYPLCVFAFM